MVIATFVRQALLDEPIGGFGDGSQTRCFAHVLDVVPQLAELVKRSDAYGLVQPTLRNPLYPCCAR
jgi:UDP-glucose 4-epimerase